MNEIIGYQNEVQTLLGHSFASWTLIAAYTALGFTGLRFAFRRDGVSYRQGRQYWFSVAMLLLFMAFNRFSNFLPGVTDQLRTLAESKDLYAFRRPIQFLVLVEVVLLAIMFIKKLMKTRHLNKRTSLTILGMLLLVTELLIKTISFHPMDSIINISVGYWTMNGLIESVGIMLVALAFTMSILRRTKTLQKLRNPAF